MIRDGHRLGHPPFSCSTQGNSQHFVRITGRFVFAGERSMHLLRVFSPFFSVANLSVAGVERCARTWDGAIVPVILTPSVKSDGKDLSA